MSSYDLPEVAGCFTAIEGSKTEYLVGFAKSFAIFDVKKGSVVKRLGAPIDTCTYTVFDYARLGLFDKDKLIVSSMLAMTVLLKDGVVDPDEYMTLCFGAKTPVPAPTQSFSSMPTLACSLGWR